MRGPGLAVVAALMGCWAALPVAASAQALHPSPCCLRRVVSWLQVLNLEEGGAFTVSSAETILEALA